MNELWKLYLENYTSYSVRTKVLTKIRCDLDLWPPKCISIFLSPSCIYVWNMKAVRWKLLKLSWQNQNLTKFCCVLDLRPLDPKMYRYFPLTILHLYMKYESCTLKTIQVIVSELKCWQSSIMIVTLTSDFWTPKCKGIFLSPSCIFVWNIKAVHWKLFKLLCHNRNVEKICCDLGLWPFDPKMYSYLPLTVLHLCMKYESCTLKITQGIVSEPKCWQSSVVSLTFDLLT